MNTKDTTNPLYLFDEVESKSITFDECKFEDNHFIGLSVDNTDSVYMDASQVKDVIEKLSRWVSKVEGSDNLKKEE